MRTGVVISLALLVAVLLGGYLAEGTVDAIATAYVGAAEELRVLTEDGAWARAEAALTAYGERWEGEQVRLKTFIKHAVVQEITMAMDRLMVGIQQQDTALCAMSCVELKQQAQLLQEQEMLSWTNLL